MGTMGHMSMMGGQSAGVWHAACEGQASWYQLACACLEESGRDRNGHPLGSGIYYYRLEVGHERVSRKMILLK